MKKITVKIDGMMCGMCESHVNDEIRKNFKVSKVTSSHKTGECVILTEEEMDEEQLKKVIEETGYKVLSIEQEEYEKKKRFPFHL